MELFTALSHRAQVVRLKRLAGAALAAYDLPGASLAPLVHRFNTTFQATDAGGNRYALRITRPGKSTVADLLIGLLEPANGRVLIDGQPLTPDRLDAWRGHIGYVAQDALPLVLYRPLRNESFR